MVKCARCKEEFERYEMSKIVLKYQESFNMKPACYLLCPVCFNMISHVVKSEIGK